MNIPEGWKASLNLAKNSVTVQAPAASDAAYSGGIITLIGIDKKGNTVFASADVCASVDYTDKDGTFVVCEGNMTSVNGMLVYYDKAGKEYREVFEQANGGLEIGNVVQDMFMANGKIYLLTQNGDRMGGAGRFVVCDARTMRMEFADPLVFKTPEDKDTWPQHLVVVSATKAYIQYSDSSMESTSGIVALTLGENSVQIGATLEGTFGAFTSVGAIKTRMVYSRGKIYAGCGHSVVIINAESGTVEKRLTYEGRQVKGIVKGVDGNIYFALAGTYSGTSPNMGTLTSDPMIVGIDHSGTVVSEKNFPEVFDSRSQHGLRLSACAPVSPILISILWIPMLSTPRAQRGTITRRRPSITNIYLEMKRFTALWGSIRQPMCCGSASRATSIRISTPMT